MATTRFDPIRATVLWCSFNRRKIALEIAPFVTRNCNCKLRETLKKDRPHNSHRKSKWRKPSISRTGDKGRCNLAKLKSLLVCLEHMKMYVHAPLFCLGFWSLSLRHLYKTSQQFKMNWFFACTLTNNQDSHCCNLKLMRLSTTKKCCWNGIYKILLYIWMKSIPITVPPRNTIWAGQENQLQQGLFQAQYTYRTERQNSQNWIHQIVLPNSNPFIF